MTSWRSNVTCLSDAGSKLMTTRDRYDVTLLVGTAPKTKTFKCHKLILSMRSDVFDNIFYGPFPEEENITITDVDPDIFMIMLTYLYTDSLKITSVQDAIKTYMAANKYIIPHLMYRCRVYIEKNLDVSNIIQTYEWSLLLHDEQLKNKCKIIVGKNLSEVLKSENFLNASQNLVENILQQDNLCDREETFIFDCVLRWVQAELKRKNLQLTPVNMRNLFDPLLLYIRFLSMNQQEFLSGPVTSGILDLDEIALIMMNMAKANFRELPEFFYKKGHKISSRETEKVLLVGHGCSNFTQVESRSITSILIVIGNCVELYGVSFFVVDSDLFPLELEIMKDKKKLISSPCQAPVIKSNVLKIHFSSPCILLPGIRYLIRAKWEESRSLCGVIVRDSFTVTEDHTMFLVSFEDSNNSCKHRPHFQEIMYNLL